MKKDETVYLRHILDSIAKIESYLQGVTEERFQQEGMMQDAVLRQLEIIGEATKQISEESRQKNAHIPWRSIAGMRDKLIHAYFKVDLKEVWRTAQNDLPMLKVEIARILNQMVSPANGEEDKTADGK